MEEIQKYLNSGPKIHAHEYQIYSNLNWPKECPWASLNGKSTENIVENVFAPLAEQLPQTMINLKRNCEDVFSLLDNCEWYLVYQLQMGSQKAEQFFIGGKSISQPKLSREIQRNGWIVPNDLVAFYQVHNGFGLLRPFDTFWLGNCILPDYKLRLLSELLPNVSDHELDYKTEDLLEFYPDGGGNGQYFYRSEIGKNIELTVDWDHETRELSHKQSFWQFVDKRLCNLLER